MSKTRTARSSRGFEIMRFHKAIEVTEQEAHAITCTSTSAVSNVVVISQGDRYFDVRTMTEAEIKAFADDLARAEYAGLKAATAHKH